MAFNVNYLPPIIIFCVSFFASHIFCGDASLSGQRQPVQANNPWQKLDTPLDTPILDLKGTTAWPELGQKRPNRIKSTTPNSIRDFVSNSKTNLNPRNPVQSQINFFENERGGVPQNNQKTNIQNAANNPNQPQNGGLPIAPPRRDFVNPNANIGQNIPKTLTNPNSQTPNLNQNNAEAPIAPPRRDFVNNPKASINQKNQNIGQLNPINTAAGNPLQIPVAPPRRDFVNNPKTNAAQHVGGVNLAQIGIHPSPLSQNNGGPPPRDFVNTPKPNAGQNNQNGGPPPRDFVNTPKPNAGQNNQNGGPPPRDFVNTPKPNAGQNNQNGGPPPRDFVNTPKPNAGQINQNGGSPPRDFVNTPKPNAGQNNQNGGPPPRDFVNTPKPNAGQNNQNGGPPPRDFVNTPKPNTAQNGQNQLPQKPGLNYAQAAQKKPTIIGTPVLNPNAPNPSKIPLSAGPTSSVDTNNYQNKPDINSDVELREFSEALAKKDVNNAAKYVTINYQGKTRSGSLNDEAPQPLLTINSEAFKILSIEKLRLLYNNYILESVQNEVYTAQEKIEENNLLDTMLSTPVMQYTRNFLIQKGKLSKDPKDFRDLLKTIWFNMYSRGGGKIGSSGFEHVFLAEIKNDAISGLHNWVYFHDEENKKLANYLGYMKKLEFEKGAIIKYHFNFHSKDKPVGSMFIGTSPEFEMALYSTCFIMRPNEACPLRLGGNNFVVRTFSYKYRGKNMIGSAFPEI